jgi:hypothetical protein
MAGVELIGLDVTAGGRWEFIRKMTGRIVKRKIEPQMDTN